MRGDREFAKIIDRIIGDREAIKRVEQLMIDLFDHTEKYGEPSSVPHLPGFKVRPGDSAFDVVDLAEKSFDAAAICQGLLAQIHSRKSYLAAATAQGTTRRAEGKRTAQHRVIAEGTRRRADRSARYAIEDTPPGRPWIAPDEIGGDGGE